MGSFGNAKIIIDKLLNFPIICVAEWMEAHKTLVTYIFLGVVVIIVLGLLLGGLVLACRRWRCPYPCCCVWRCFQDRDQMRGAAHNLYSAPRTITWGIQHHHESLIMQVGLSYTYQYCKQLGLLCHTVRDSSSAILPDFQNTYFTHRLTFVLNFFRGQGSINSLNVHD